MCDELKARDRLNIDGEVWLSSAACSVYSGLPKKRFEYANKCGRLRKMKKGQLSYYPASEVMAMMESAGAGNKQIYEQRKEF